MTREIRLGIVLYGGVSLAVYENGVAQELHRAVGNLGIYSLISKLIDSRIVVDIVSGTSAGGVNGVMLAYALARRTDFSRSAELWREQGDIMRLLREPGDPNAASVLNSTYYQQKLEECFKNTLSQGVGPGVYDELDLFITGTDANGEIYTVYDDQGHAIDVKNHRALFKLSIRKGGRKDDVGNASPADLAKLARLTSCFPVAFEPVAVADAKPFKDWGKLRGAAVYLDGGILNNKPFTSTIEAITTRVANCETERFLIYVEPDPEQFAAQPPGTPPHSPCAAEAGADALFSIPGYQSIAGDLQDIEAHNERASRIAAILEAVGPPPDSTWDCLDKTTVLPADGKCDSSAYLAARAIQLRNAAVGGILNDKDGRPYIRLPEERRCGRILVESFDCWPGDPNLTLTSYDVFFRMRRAAHLVKALMRLLRDRRLDPDTATWELLNHYFKLYEMTRWAMTEWLSRWDYTDWRKLSSQYPQLDLLDRANRQATLGRISTEVWGSVEARMKILLEGNIPVPATPDAEARASFYRDLNNVMEGRGFVVMPNLLWRIDQSFKEALKRLPATPVSKWLCDEYCRFIEIDRQIFPILYGAESESTDIIRIVRFSPRDAQRALSSGTPSTKVCGSSLGAFGGFFKKSWRANDIMIGRFDACCQLIEILVTRERLAELDPVITLDDISGAFRYEDRERDRKLLDAINRYLARPRDSSQDSWENLVNALVSAAQDDIQKEEWPRVIQAAISQDYEWSQYRSVTLPPVDPYSPPHLAWRRGRRKPDQVLAQVAANALAAGVIPPFLPGSVAGRSFLDEIPQAVLQELASLAGIRVGRSLLNSISKDETRQRVAGSGFYKWPFDRFFPLFYRLARMRRTQPDTAVLINMLVPLICIVAIALLLLLLYFQVQPTWNLRFGLTMLIPVAILWLWSKVAGKTMAFYACFTLSVLSLLLVYFRHWLAELLRG